MRRWLLLLFLWSSALAAMPDVAFQPHPGAVVPADARFREARLGEYFGGAPIVLVLGYVGCVNLCGTTLNGVAEALHETGLKPGRDYTALFASIDPRDERAPPKRRPGWHFLTGAAAAARVAQAVGFRYAYEAQSGQFAHPAGFVLLTPQGAVARYFQGVRFDADQLRDAISRARTGEPQSPFARLLLVCFHDPLNGRNTPAVMAGVRIASVLLLVAFGVFAWRRLR
jgi:protein SCO1/2